MHRQPAALSGRQPAALSGELENGLVLLLSLEEKAVRQRDLIARLGNLLGGARKHSALDAIRRLESRGLVREKDYELRPRRSWRFRRPGEKVPCQAFLFLPVKLRARLGTEAARSFGFRDYYDLAAFPRLAAFEKARAFHASRSPRTTKEPAAPGGRGQAANSDYQDGRYRSAAVSEEAAAAASMCLAAIDRGGFCRTTKRMVRRHAPHTFRLAVAPLTAPPLTADSIRESVKYSRASSAAAHRTR